MNDRFFVRAGAALLAIAWTCTLCSAQSVRPRLFFSDLVSGPNTGGQNNQGAIVTIWGSGFGATRGTSFVTVGGHTVDSYPTWSDTKVSFQLGSAAASGNITLTTSVGASNGLPFTVRAGNIYFVATSGNDSNNGSFSAPWRSILKAKSSIAAGDIAYIMDGVAQTSQDNYNASLVINSGGTAAAPKALVAYPGASVTIGTQSSPYGLRTPAISGAKDYWVLSGINFRGVAAIDLLDVTGWRVIGNDFSCPTGSGQSACFHTDTTMNLSFYGNYVHNVGDAAGSIDKYYHAVYFTTNSNHIDAGWNTIVPNPTGSTKSGGCRAIQFYSTGGSDQFDLHVHDNVIHDAICDGINFSTVNPNNGTVEAYNNLVYHVGTGPDPANGSSNYACITTGSGSNPTASVEIYNNTLYDCGSRGTSDAGALALGTKTRLRNNLIRTAGSGTYLASSWSSSCTVVTGSNNLWFGNGSPTSCTSANVNTDPLFVNLAGKDFRLQSTSPAKDAGIAIAGLAADLGGIVRPQGSSFDLGAYEYNSGSGGTTGSACDLTGDRVVNQSDVDAAISQALGVTACGTADLDASGTCTVVDVQRVINASQGGACRVGQ